MLSLLLLLGLLILNACNETKLSAVNNFVNKFTYKSDQSLYNQEDYWQSPYEFMNLSEGGDCEDYSITKAFLLLESGHVTEDDLKFALLQSKFDPNAHHMVLVVHDMYVLDNAREEVAYLWEYILPYNVIGYFTYKQYFEVRQIKRNEILARF